jgi:threonine dehydratase
LGIAALRAGRLASLAGLRTAVVVTGRNIGPDTLRRVLAPQEE